MTQVAAKTLARALRPIVTRVRCDVTAVKRQDGSRWTNEPLTPEALLAHVSGGTARGVCPIKAGESTTMLALLDFDSHKGEVSWDGMVAVAASVMDLLELDGCAPVAFRSSGGRGIHVFLIWDRPQDAYSVRSMLRDVLGALGYSDGAKGVKHHQIEVFPKQDSVDHGGYGNQFILPLAGQSEPLERLFDLMPMGKDYATQVPWAASPDVSLRQRPITERADIAASVEPIAKVREALAAIPNDPLIGCPDYDGWFRIGLAVHEATGGSDEGLEAFLEWSAQNAEKHDEKFARERVWDYMKNPDGRRGGAVTRATLFAQASGLGWAYGGERTADGFEDVPEQDVSRAVALVKADRQEVSRKKHEAKSRWRTAIMEARDEVHLQDEVCQAVSADRLLEAVDREMLAETLKQKFANLGVKLSIAACRKLLAPAKREVTTDNAPKWTQSWVYITSEDKFFLTDSEEFLTAQGFNAKFNRYLPPPKDGELPKSAHRVALDDYGIPTVTRAIYAPHLEPMFTANGVECVNLYRPSSTPTAAPSLTAEDRADMDLLERHIAMMCGQREELSKVLLSWMAFNVQNPGRKVRWAPLIKGMEGDGKSLIGRVMAAAMGRSNVKEISPKVLQTDFTGWAHGACIGVLEELRLTGHSRYDVHNALKPYITNDDIAIHAKGKDEYTAMNTMNYIAFTNHEDALPLNNNDRRFMVIFSPFRELSDLTAVVGDTQAYFDKLYDVINTKHAEIRRWLLDMPLHPSFKSEGRALDTDEKHSMIDMSVSQEEDAFNAAIQEGGIGVGKNVLVMRHLRDLAATFDPEVAQLHASVSSKILLKMGWARMPKQMRWRGEVCRVWHKGIGVNPTNFDIQQLLDATAVGPDCNALDADEF